MRIVQHTIWIARAPEAVFDFFIDLSQGHQWRQYVTSMTLASDPPLGAGSVVHVRLDLLGRPYDFDLEVLAFERPALWRHRTNESDFTGCIEYRFDPDRGGTRVTMTMDARPTGLYGWLAVPLMFLRRDKPYAEQLPQLKRALEAGTGRA
jgi:hypothetical protein